MRDAEPRTADLKPMQTWISTNGLPPRQIQDIFVATLGSNHRAGTVLVHWASDAARWGTCTIAAFRSWIRKEKAYLK